MADILIRGMEMPKDCPHCEFAAIGYLSPMSSDCTLYCRAVDKFKDCATAVLENKPYEEISRYETRPDWCPLIALPEGHGRLIDADAFLAKNAYFTDKDFVDAKYEDTLRDLVNRASTIVPADEEGV